ncbi:MAG: hypothetical protein JXR70_03530 [Spirochaetales bacterium]|nr:hypothetical protein [Spirochaetales bacterium]
MKKPILFLFSVLIAITVIQCSGNGNSKKPDQSQEESVKKDETNTFVYSKDVKPIIARRCDKCHGGSSTKFADLSEPEEVSKLLFVVKEDIMPKDKALPEAEKQIVLTWLESLE